MNRRTAVGGFALLIVLVGPLQARDQDGPWNADLWLLESTDELDFRDGVRAFTRAGVPTLLADRQGRLVALFQWFPDEPRESFDRIAVSISLDSGKTWPEPRTIVVEDLPADMIRPCDPAAVELEDGAFRLYFTSDAPASGDRVGRPTPEIYSAISQDGVTYRFEPEVRFGVEGEIVIDCTVARLGDAWHLYSPIQDRPGSAYHAVSTDGVTFEREADVKVSTRGTWLGAVVACEGGLRFFGSGGDGGWSATSSDGANWTLDPDHRRERESADPGVARAPDGRWLMLATRADRRESGGNQPRPRDPGRGCAEFYEFFREFDSTAAVRHESKVHEIPKLVELGRKVELRGGGFPRLVKMGERFYAFTAGQDGYFVVEYDSQWNRTGRQKRLSERGVREIDQAITSDGESVYHYIMLRGAKGRVRKYDANLELVAETEVFRAGPTGMILDQNIFVRDGMVYAAGEYREGGPWAMDVPGEQNTPPDARVARGMHLRIFDHDLRPIDQRDLVGEIDGAAIPNQFWGLGASQISAGGYHCLVVHSPVGNVAKFDHGESIGARQIFVLRYDSDFRFVDSKGPLSDTDRDNSWCTGAVHHEGRTYIAYISVAQGCIPGPGVETDDPIVQNVRLGIFDENFEELETIDVTPPGSGGGWPGLIAAEDRVCVTWSATTGDRGGSWMQEFRIAN